MDWTYFTAPSRTHRSSFWLRVRPGTLLYVKLVVFAADEVRGQVLGREAGLHRCEDLPGVVVVDVRLLEGLRHEVELREDVPEDGQREHEFERADDAQERLGRHDLGRGVGLELVVIRADSFL